MAGRMEIQSVHRAFDILEAVGNSKEPVSLKHITEMTALPKSTVYRLLRNLEERNYIHCDSSGRYNLGFQLLMISKWAENDFEIKQLARPHLESLNEFTKETVHLAILEKNRVLYIDTVESPHAVRLVAKLGTTNSVHCTSLGKALLMNCSDDRILELLQAQPMEKRTEYTRATPEEYLQEMKTVREQGYALDNRESELDGLCVGAPIYNSGGEIIAAISVSGLVTRFSEEFIRNEVASRLLDSTQSISRILGYTQ